MMPNNVLILAYIQSMKDRIKESIIYCDEQNSNGNRTISSHNHKAYLKDLINLEKFIKGGK